MNVTDSIMNGLAAAFAMARGRKDWADHLDMSPENVFRSFWAVPLALPGLFLASAGAHRMAISLGQSPAPLWAVLFSSVVTTLVIWGLIVLFYIMLAKRIEAGWRISPVLIVNNYTTLLGYCLLGLAMGGASIAGSTALFSFAWPAVMILGVWLDWGMLRRGMGLMLDTAVVVIAFIQLAALTVSSIIGSVLTVILSGFLGIEA